MTLYNSKRKMSKITITAIAAFLVSLGAIIAFGNKSACWAWNTFAVPDVERRINTKIEPVNDALLYNSALHEATMTSAQIDKAAAIYEAKRKGHITNR